MNEFKTFLDPKSPASKFIGLCLYSSAFMHSAHFSTKSYAHHKVYEDFYKDMPELIDTFAEIYLGSGNTYKKEFPKDFDSSEALLESIIKEAGTIYQESCSAGQSALDDITTLCKKTKYLLTLN